MPSEAGTDGLSETDRQSARGRRSALRNISSKSSATLGTVPEREVTVLPDFSVHRASELAADETISVNAWRPHDAPSGERMQGRQAIMAQAREIGSRAPGMSADEADELVAEAHAAIRSSRG